MLFKMVRLPEDRARALLASPVDADALLFDSAHPELDLDKAWHVLHLLLAGDIDGDEGPAGFLMSGGRPVGEGSYGPPRLFLPDEVAAIAEEVARVSEADLRALDGHEDLDSVYGGWEGSLSDDEFRYYADHLEALQAFVAASAGSALLLTIY